MEATPALPLAYWSTKMATDQTSGSTPGTFTTLTFVTDVLQFGDAGIIDKPTTSQLRALVPGYYRASYSLAHYNNGNNNVRTAEARLFRNGTTAILDSRSASIGDNADNEEGNLNCSPIVLMAANDYLEVQVAPKTNTSHTFPAPYGFFRLELVRLT